MREIRLAHLDKTRPVVILTRNLALETMMKVTVAPITTTLKGLSSEVPVGALNGLDHGCAIAVDNVVTIPKNLIGRFIGCLTAEQEQSLARALVLAYDLEITLDAE